MEISMTLVKVLIAVFVVVLIASLALSCTSNYVSKNHEKIATQSFSLFYSYMEPLVMKNEDMIVSDYTRMTLTLPKNYFIYGFHSLGDQEVELINPDKCGKYSCVCLFHGEFEPIDMDKIKVNNNNYEIPKSQFEIHQKNSDKAVVCKNFPPKPAFLEFIPNIYTQYEDNLNFDKAATQAVMLAEGKGFAQPIVLGVKRIIKDQNSFKEPIWLTLYGLGTRPDQKNLPAEGFQVNKKAQVIAGVMPEESIENPQQQDFCSYESGAVCGQSGFAISIGEDENYNNPYISASRCKGISCEFPGVCYYKLSFPLLGESLTDIGSTPYVEEYEGSCVLPGYKIELEMQQTNSIAGKLNTYTTITLQPTGTENTQSPEYSGEQPKSAVPFSTEGDKKLWCGDTYMSKDAILILGNYRDDQDYCIYKEVRSQDSFKDYEAEKKVYLTLVSEYGGVASNR